MTPEHPTNDIQPAAASPTASAPTTEHPKDDTAPLPPTSFAAGDSAAAAQAASSEDKDGGRAAAASPGELVERNEATEVGVRATAEQDGHTAAGGAPLSGTGSHEPPATGAAPLAPPFASPEDLARQLASFTLPSQSSSSSPGASSPPPSSASALPSRPPQPTAQKKQEEEEEEEEWPLKEILWPPLPPTPEAANEAGAAMRFEVDPRLRVKVICQNRNGPCSLIALCNILILRSDLTLSPGRGSVSYSYLSTLLADYFLRITSSSSGAGEGNLSLEAALSILPQTRYGLTLNPRFDRIDGFAPPSSSSSSTSTTPTSSPSRDHQGELSLFALARVPLLHGWLSDPSLPSQHAALLEAGDYDTALEWVVEGSEVAGEGGLEWGEGGREGDMGVEEVEREVERRSGWTGEQRKKVERASLLHRFLTTSPTQLTYSGLFALSSSPLLPPSGLAALFRNSHLSVLYRRPNLPQPTSPSTSSSAVLSTPELFTLVTDAGFVDEPGVVWESLGDTDGEASEFWGADLGRARVRDREREGREREERRRREQERVMVEGGAMEVGGADLALAQQLQAEEDAYERDLAYHQQQHQQQEQQQRRPPADEKLRRQQAALKAEEDRWRGSIAGGKKKEKGRKEAGKGEKEKCLVM